VIISRRCSHIYCVSHTPAMFFSHMSHVTCHKSHVTRHLWVVALLIRTPVVFALVGDKVTLGNRVVTRRVGCGLSSCANLKVSGGRVWHNAAFYACYYNPPGNHPVAKCDFVTNKCEYDWGPY
jgi:hypothetical protein